MLKSLLQRVTAFTAAMVLAAAASAGEGRILVQSTTSTQNSGLYDYLIPLFEKETGLRVDVVAVGTGQAIKNAANGDADVLLVHAKPAELEFVKNGYGKQRLDLMYNDFVIIGPTSDPAHLIGTTSVYEALKTLKDSKQIFVSRGDDSGTHKKEHALWENTKLSPDAFSSDWYRETGSGMGATIRMAIEANGYTLTDRATWIAFGDKQDHKVVVSGDPELFNQYGVIAVNPEKFPHANVAGAQTFIDWLTSTHGQELIAEYTVQGQQLFFPNAQRTAAKPAE